MLVWRLSLALVQKYGFNCQKRGKYKIYFSVSYSFLYNPEKRQLHSLSIDKFRDLQCSRLFLGLMANTIQILKQLSASRVEQLKNGPMRVRYVDVEVFVHSLMETHALVCKFWLNKFNSRIMESSAHAFFDFASKPLVCQYLIHSTNSIPKLWNHHHIGII